MLRIAALDIGGANVKACGPDGGALTRPFELWRRPGELAGFLGGLLETIGPAECVAVTMTGELCDGFETKVDGVRSILESVREACDEASSRPEILVWRTDRRLASLDEALRDPLPAAAANWLALACFAGRFAPRGRALLVDAGSTTVDIIPLEDGRPIPAGLTDTERLLSGELVYTGASRTPVAAVVRELPCRGRLCPVSSELFATTRDAYLILGLAAEDPGDPATADGRPATRAYARDRLARMVCADRETFGEDDALAAARHIVGAQAAQLRHAAATVEARAGGPPGTIIVSGSGELLARCAVGAIEASSASRIVSLAAELGAEASAAAPAVALASLASEWIISRP